MSEVLKQLIRRRIEMAERVHDYVQLRFDDNSVLNIFNPISIAGDSRNGLSSLIGHQLTEVGGDEAVVKLALSNGASIQVGLSESDFNGPEAMEYIAADGTIVIWP